MKFYGISGAANTLMKSYLKGRHQKVAINTHNNPNEYISKWKEVQHGVPQGSVLGPLLFLININDLSRSVSNNSSPILFADDTSFIIVNRNVNEFQSNTNEVFKEINK
jgi:hypothetical protein